MYASVLSVDLRIPLADSLKVKRSAIVPILEGGRRRFGVSVAEVAHADLHGRAELAFATVASDESGARRTLDEVERFVWSFPEVEVIATWRNWIDDEEHP